LLVTQPVDGTPGSLTPNPLPITAPVLRASRVAWREMLYAGVGVKAVSGDIYYHGNSQ